MPTPPPPEHARWKPGQSGNPAGSSSGRRITSALRALIDQHKADPALARVWLAKALGDDRMLKKDDGTYLDPHLGWFALLIERLEGKAQEAEPDDAIGIVNVTIKKVGGKRNGDRKPDPEPGP